MARFDVYANPDDGGWLLDLQTNLLEGLSTRIVVPLMPVENAPTAAHRLNPLFEIAGSRVVMVTQFLAAVPISILRNPQANLSAHPNLSARRATIVDAVDMVFQGY